MKARQGSLDLGNRAMKPAKPGEFEDYVANLIGRRLPRYGEDLLLPSQRDFAAPATASVPADYPLNVGDAVSLSFTGSISGSLSSGSLRGRGIPGAPGPGAWIRP